jgi:hypothetical protein
MVFFLDFFANLFAEADCIAICLVCLILIPSDSLIEVYLGQNLKFADFVAGQFILFLDTDALLPLFIELILLQYLQRRLREVVFESVRFNVIQFRD